MKHVDLLLFTELVAKVKDKLLENVQVRIRTFILLQCSGHLCFIKWVKDSSKALFALSSKDFTTKSLCVRVLCLNKMETNWMKTDTTKRWKCSNLSHIYGFKSPWKPVFSVCFLLSVMGSNMKAFSYFTGEIFCICLFVFGSVGKRWCHIFPHINYQI